MGYNLDFDLTVYTKLDNFALLAWQEYNLGNDTDWFSAFRGGYYGFNSRIHGVKLHYNLVHSWIPQLRLPVEIEYHIASILFNMDSAFECLIYALNALGNSVSSENFRDITSRRQLSDITPRDILGIPSAKSSKEQPMKGYTEIFPDTQKYCMASRSLIQTIVELHDVSKHREAIFVGSRKRDDPPPSFFESLGIADDSIAMTLCCPWAEILFPLDPKAPKVDRTPAERHEYPTLEDLAEKFVEFIHQFGRLAFEDSNANIHLAHREFLGEK